MSLQMIPVDVLGLVNCNESVRSLQILNQLCLIKEVGFSHTNRLTSSTVTRSLEASFLGTVPVTFLVVFLIT